MNLYYLHTENLGSWQPPKMYTLPETNSSPLKVGSALKGKDRFPTCFARLLTIIMFHKRGRDSPLQKKTRKA